MYLNSHLAPFSFSGFQRREAPLKPAPLSGAHSAPDNGARFKLINVKYAVFGSN
jgi:hypothetical protein